MALLLHMNTKHTTLFISDLHLSPEHSKITHAFFYFLENIAYQADALYILGDFFEVYVGDDDRSNWLQSIQDALRTLTQSGVLVYFMYGNRDFLTGQNFFLQTGVMFIPDPSVICIHGENILLMHGDSLCTLDKNHQQFRKITRWQWVQKLFLALPLSIRKNIANQLRKKSVSQNQYQSKVIMDVAESTVTENMLKYNVKTLIHGHTHQPKTHSLLINNQPAKRIVLGAWHEKGNYLRSQDGEYEWVEW